MINTEYKITQEASLCKECGKPIMIFLLEGERIRSKKYPGLEEVCDKCIPPEVKQEIKKTTEALGKKIAEVLGYSL